MAHVHGLEALHAAIRADLRRRQTPGIYFDRGWSVLNQQELLGTLLSFTITVFDVLEMFGMAWSVEEQAAYLHLWDVVGAYLGIASREAITELGPSAALVRGWLGLRPPRLDDTRGLLYAIQSWQWASPRPGQASPVEATSGRLLVRALLDLLTACMPPSRRSWPIAVMRQLSPPVVNERPRWECPASSWDL